MDTATTLVDGRAVPAFFYGTAWKEDATARCVDEALAAGFRAIDTANQRKHYHEAGVGEAVRRWLATHPRDSLFLQTKFTYARGQDHRLPYDPSARPAEQVRQSFRRSLEHLGVDAIDSLVLHGPELGRGLTHSDDEVWRTFEELHDEGKVAFLGISNVSPAQLELLLERARSAPTFVQNRCYADRGWDADVRAICHERGIRYQGFSLLTANRHVVAGPLVREIAARVGASPEQVVFRFALHVGMIVLTGTTNPAHMRGDLSCTGFALTDADVGAILRG
jgi:diketogulonate reductase-like aldo/keto reductase